MGLSKGYFQLPLEKYETKIYMDEIVYFSNIRPQWTLNVTKIHQIPSSFPAFSLLVPGYIKHIEKQWTKKQQYTFLQENEFVPDIFIFFFIRG